MTSPSHPIWTAKQFIRKHLISPVQSRLASRRLAHFVEATRAGLRPDFAAIARLRRAWGNEAYSADATYIAEIITQSDLHAGPILECGTGVTTLVAALIAEGRNEKVWCLEQDPVWASFVRERLAAYAIKNVEVIYAPLKNYGDFVWYDIEAVSLPRKFGLVLCDGPAVFPHWGDSHHQWRYGLIPVLLRMGIDLDAILLDDADEPRASKLLERWTKESALVCRMHGSGDGTCAILFRANTSDA